MTWPESVFSSVTMICIMLVGLRTIAAYERLVKRRERTELEESEAE